MPEEPKKIVTTERLDHGSNLELKFTAEVYENGVFDTRVEIEAGTMCWITWKDREAFRHDLFHLIGKYAI